MYTLLQRYERLKELIACKRTGSPSLLAQKLGISRSTLFRYLSQLNDIGYPAKYCYFHESYIPDITKIGNKWNIIMIKNSVA